MYITILYDGHGSHCSIFCAQYYCVIVGRVALRTITDLAQDGADWTRDFMSRDMRSCDCRPEPPYCHYLNLQSLQCTLSLRPKLALPLM